MTTPDRFDWLRRLARGQADHDDQVRAARIIMAVVHAPTDDELEPVSADQASATIDEIRERLGVNP